MKLTRLTSALAAAGVTSTLLVACGGGGGGDPVAPSPPPIAVSVELEGVAAIGRAFEGAMVSVTDSTGKPASMATPVGADGKYMIDVTGLTAPLVIMGDGRVALILDVGSLARRARH